MNLGARVADLVFTTQLRMEESVEFASKVRGLAKKFGRGERDVKVLPGMTPIIGATKSEAEELADSIGSAMSERAAIEFMKQSFGGVDLSAYDPVGPFPNILDQLPPHASVSRPKLFVETALAEGLTVRQMVQRVGMSIGHRLVVGTADSIADDMELWFKNEAADGFIIIPADLPLGLKDFVDEVVPRLQQRGLFREQYQGRTLKEHLAS